MRITRNVKRFFNKFTLAAFLGTLALVEFEIIYWAWCYIHMVD